MCVMGLLGADPELECRLRDIEYLLDGRDGSTYADLPCHDPQRLEFEERFWWLTDPLMGDTRQRPLDRAHQPGGSSCCFTSACGR